MWTSATTFAAVIIGLIAVAILISYYRLVFGLRGQRVVTCPETREDVGVEIDAPLAARTMLVDNPSLRITKCTRWPEKADCMQECLTQVEAHPEDTLLRNILGTWYLDKDCATCGRPIGQIQWHDPIPGLRAADGRLVGWDGVKAEQVAVLLDTCLPVCWNCFSAETFRAEYPGLVTDRSETPLRNRLIH